MIILKAREVLLEWCEWARGVVVKRLTMPPVRSVASERVLECHAKTGRGQIDSWNSGVIGSKGKRGVVLSRRTTLLYTSRIRILVSTTT